MKLSGKGKARKKKREKMRKVTSTPEERERLAREIGKHLENGAMLQVSITSTSRTNMNYRYKVNLFFNYENAVECWHLTYWLAGELGKNLTDSDELKGNGCGFDRYHDTAYTIAEILRKRYGFAFSLQNLPKYVRGN